MMKKTKLSVLMAAALASQVVIAQVKDYQLLVPTGNTQLSTYNSIESLYGDWTETGGHYDCGAWQPDPLTVDYGQMFLQERLCSQDYVRDVTYREQDSFSGDIRVIRVDQETKTGDVTEVQNGTGERRDWSATTSTYTAWADASGPHGYTDWVPASGLQTASYSQTRDYQVTQERYEQKREQDAVTGDIRDVGDPILQTQEDTRSQSRSVSVASSAWANTAAKVCGAWSPDPSTVDYGTSFTQTRTCDQDQERVWTHTSGGSEVYSRTESRVNTFDETQQVTGTYQDWQPMTSSASAWTNTGSGYNYTAWSPTASTQTTNFTQTRDYSQDQTRTVQQREYDSITGQTRTVGDPVTESQTVTLSEFRDVSVSASSWVNSGGHYSCSAWSPDPATVNQGQSFTQSRSCSQNQTRTWTYTSNGSTIHTRSQSRTITEGETRTTTGTKPTKQCAYSQSGTKYFVRKDRSGSGSMGTSERWGAIAWGGTFIPTDANCVMGVCTTYTSFPYNYNGYRYSAGAFKAYGAPDYYGVKDYYYEVCREKL